MFHGHVYTSYLVWSTVLKAALNKEVAKAVDHERVGLSDNSLHDLVLLLGGADLELLLKEDRCLLVIVADDLVDDILPVAIDVAVQQSAIVERLGCREPSRTFSRGDLMKGGSACISKFMYKCGMKMTYVRLREWTGSGRGEFCRMR